MHTDLKQAPRQSEEKCFKTGGGKFNYDMLVRTFENVTMYPSTIINK
jgi:hypothetical protein